MDGVTKVVPEPTVLPPEELVYQLSVEPDVAVRVTDPGPQRLALLPEGVDGT